jgi:prepilin-type N-terminal cleavage/methylation domain-containing protein
MHKEDGFTLIEVLSAIMLMLILLGLSANSMRSYWLNQSLSGAQGSVRSQLRQLQERSVSESHPTVYGVRFQVGTSNWGVVQYDPTATPSPKCTQVNNLTLNSGVIFKTAPSTTFTAAAGSDAATITALCKSQIAGSASDQFVLFFARGTATPGQVTLTHSLVARTKVITVTAITGRVEATP